MKKLTLVTTTLLLALASGASSADPANPADVILSNPGKFNAAPAICMLFGAEILGECVKFVQTFVVSPPACDGNLHTDAKVCGNNRDE
jgi:hypothetical protein